MHLHFLGSIFDKRHRSKLRHALLCGPHQPQHKPTLDLIGRVKRDDKKNAGVANQELLANLGISSDVDDVLEHFTSRFRREITQTTTADYFLRL